MTPVLKKKEEAEAEEKKKEFEGQLTQLEAMFTLDKVNILISLRI
jgi:hypothetical protein